jgi:hypothetical protein
MRQQKTIENEVAEAIVFRIDASRIAATMKKFPAYQNIGDFMIGFGGGA